MFSIQIVVSLLGFFAIFISAHPYCDNHNVTYLPHRTHCDKFYQCSNGYLYLLKCPRGLHFNKKLNVCDWPQNAGCNVTRKEFGPRRATTKCTKNYTRVPNFNTTISTITVNVTEKPLNRQKKHDLYSVEYFNSTRKFENDVTTPPANTDLTSSTSDIIFITTSESRMNSTSNINRTTKKPTPGTRTDLTRTEIEALLHGRKCRFYNFFKAPHPTDCTKYIECFLRSYKVKSCPVNLYFSWKQNKCLPSKIVDCAVPTTTAAFTTKIY